MSNWLLDLVRQVTGILGIRNGGNGNDRGYATGIVKPCLNKGNIDDAHVSMPRGTVVRLVAIGLGDWRVVLATEDDPRVLGVVVGRFEQDGVTFVDDDVAYMEIAAVMVAGTCVVLTDVAVVHGQYAYVSATPGMAKGLDVASVGAFGRLQSSGDAGSATVVLPFNGSPDGLPRGAVEGDLIESISGIPAWGHPPLTTVIGTGATAFSNSVTSEHPPAHAIDGDPATNWQPDGGGGYDAGKYIGVDLGVPYTVSRWQMLQGLEDAYSADTYSVESSDDDTTWTMRVASHDRAGHTDETVLLPAPIHARYWRFTWLTGYGDVWRVRTLDLLATLTEGFQPLRERGQPDGYAPLDGGALVPLANLPSGIGGGAPLSDADPLPDAVAADPGTGLASSREDHVHIGEAGPSGADGDPGSPGTDGADGIDGADGLGVPAGGTIHQVLTKLSSTDNDTDWETPSAAPSALDDLTDVDAASPTDGQALAWDAGASAWTPQTITGGGGGIAAAVYVSADVQTVVERAAGLGPVIWSDPAITDPAGFWNPATPTRLTVPAGKDGLYSAGP